MPLFMEQNDQITPPPSSSIEQTPLFHVKHLHTQPFLPKQASLSQYHHHLAVRQNPQTPPFQTLQSRPQNHNHK